MVIKMYLMGFDYGSKKIGVAIGQTITATASPLAIVQVKNKQIDWPSINSLIQEWRPNKLIVGLPKHADGSDNIMTVAVQRFCRQLHGRYHLPVHTIDERLSSNAAAERVTGQLDAVSAQIILETWLSG
ncbi:Holliday junction resolvase RuvX [Candidatus Halobeggiatoa sp. HSG11]|nr:Holliday junction resolvase RuvX [Candidatus Halobeggiatoa sp. HSG11]